MFRPTAAQSKALRLIKSGAKHILLFGGSRSGKTTQFLSWLLYIAPSAMREAVI
jgi:Flp pilus assembly CpaF family ATPase